MILFGVGFAVGGLVVLGLALMQTANSSPQGDSEVDDASNPTGGENSLHLVNR
jgi:hypothetical protein